VDAGAGGGARAGWVMLGYLIVIGLAFYFLAPGLMKV
jgi:hypothetical protein